MDGIEKNMSCLIETQDSPSFVRIEIFHWRSRNPLPTTTPSSITSFLNVQIYEFQSHIKGNSHKKKLTAAIPQTILKELRGYIQIPLLGQAVPYS